MIDRLMDESVDERMVDRTVKEWVSGMTVRQIAKMKIIYEWAYRWMNNYAVKG